VGGTHRRDRTNIRLRRNPRRLRRGGCQGLRNNQRARGKFAPRATRNPTLAAAGGCSRLHRPPPPETPAISPDATDADADHRDGECRANNWQAPRIRLRYGLQERAPHAPAPKKIEYLDWARSKATAPFSIPARAASLRKSCTPRVRALRRHRRHRRWSIPDFPTRTPQVSVPGDYRHSSPVDVSFAVLRSLWDNELIRPN